MKRAMPPIWHAVFAAPLIVPACFYYLVYLSADALLLGKCYATFFCLPLENQIQNGAVDIPVTQISLSSKYMQGLDTPGILSPNLSVLEHWSTNHTPIISIDQKSLCSYLSGDNISDLIKTTYWCRCVWLWIAHCPACLWSSVWWTTMLQNQGIS